MYKLHLFIIFAILVSGSFLSCDPKDDPDNCEDCNVVYKPNIYIYPTKTIDLQIKLFFPLGGGIITSIPDYHEGWNVRVDEYGQIDNKYTFLFYESEQPDIWQRTEGWTIKRSNLETFFKTNMPLYGFNQSEINDFINYWIPRLNSYPYYSIYPQTADIIDEVIELNLSTKADKIQRLFYLVKGSTEATNPSILEPRYSNYFKREGFVVMEWGVILDE